MQRIFFHNRHDAVSRDTLAGLGDDVLIYDVFGDDRYSLPADIPLQALPYMVDKYISFTPKPPYLVDAPFVLEFQCMDYKDNALESENGLFEFDIDGLRYSANAVGGVIQVQITCPEARTVAIAISGQGYLPLKTEVAVGAKS